MKPVYVPIITGPTAAGKTALAVRIARERGWEIISCDSRQMYRHMDIATAKPRAAERDSVRHWLIDVLDPSEHSSAYLFVNEARAIIHELAAQGRTALLCGGTGLYLESLRRGMSPQAATDHELQKRLMRRIDEEGCAVLHRELASCDPRSAARIHENDAQRIVRALSVIELTGCLPSDLARRSEPPEDLRFVVAVTAPPRPLLYQRINRRVERMAGEGLWEEFVALRGLGYDESSPGMATVGYRELFPVERGECSLPEALERIKRHSRRYAKRQMTWFRHRNEGEFIAWSDDEDVLYERVAQRLSGE